VPRSGFFNAKSLKNRRQDLRKKPTPAEKILWEELRNRKLGCKFYRQYSISGYVLDFYCPEKRLGIELEGKIHKKSEVKIADKYRFRYLEAFGTKIVRIPNETVLKKIEEVMEEIKMVV
jgi:very-short-patch-repair endonuclease